MPAKTGARPGARSGPEGAKAEIVEFADVVKSLRLHWRISVAIVLLAGLAFALFLITRKQVQPPNRYRVAVQILVPAADDKGVRPVGVPPSLLQGQVQRALNPDTENTALDIARVPQSRRSSVEFGFNTNATNDIITLTATANDRSTASTAARAFESAYVATRETAVANGAVVGQASAKDHLKKLSTSLAATDEAIDRADPGLVAKLKTTTPGKDQSITESLPQGTSDDIVLLVVQRQAVVAQIAALQISYAQNVITSLIPQGFANIVEIDAPVQITPPLPSPLVPALVFLAVGLALALAVPVLMDRLDHSIRNAKSAGNAFEATVLAQIPPTSRRLRRSLTVPGTAPDSAYRALAATSIATDQLPQAIVVTSPTGIVQDTVAANFAAALAGLGLRVALVATDPRQSWFLDTRRDNGESTNGESTNGESTNGESTNGESGLSFPELLDLAHRGRLNGALPRGLVKTRMNNLLVMPPGGEPGEFTLDGLRPLLEALSAGGVDVTVIAGPALLEDPNATIFAWTTRCVLWACETGELSEAEAKEAAARLALAGATSFGVTMVNGKT